MIQESLFGKSMRYFFTFSLIQRHKWRQKNDFTEVDFI